MPTLGAAPSKRVQEAFPMFALWPLWSPRLMRGLSHHPRSQSRSCFGGLDPRLPSSRAVPGGLCRLQSTVDRASRVGLHMRRSSRQFLYQQDLSTLSGSEAASMAGSVAYYALARTHPPRLVQTGDCPWWLCAGYSRHVARTYGTSIDSMGCGTSNLQVPDAKQTPPRRETHILHTHHRSAFHVQGATTKHGRSTHKLRSEAPERPSTAFSARALARGALTYVPCHSEVLRRARYSACGVRLGCDHLVITRPGT